jgi:transposase, IS5 family
MVREKHEQVDIFESMLPLGDIVLDPVLQHIDELLDQAPEIMNEIKIIFQNRRANSKTCGRGSHPVEVILRLIILKHLKSWRLRDTVEEVKYNFAYRKFTRLYFEKVPHYSILSRYENLIPESTIKKINERLIEVAKAKDVTKGYKFRIDTTVVEANIHHPTDSSLLYDSIRVINRIIQRAKETKLAAGELTRNTMRQAKRRLLEIVKYAQKRSEEKGELIKESYRRLISLTKQVVKKAVNLKNNMVQQIAGPISIETEAIIHHLTEMIDRFVPRIKSVIHQATQRVLRDRKVASHEKILSLFQPKSYVIRKGKARRPVEFGQVVKIQEADGKIITDYEILSSNSGDRELLLPSIEKHKELFGRPPRLVATDRGFYSEELEEKVASAGVKKVAMPKIGNKDAQRIKHEKQSWFRQGQRFRAGSEGSISVLKRGYGMDRCLNKREDGFGSWVGWRVVARNLKLIAQAV